MSSLWYMLLQWLIVNLKKVFILILLSQRKAYFPSILFQKGISGIFIIVRKILSYWRLYWLVQAIHFLCAWETIGYEVNYNMVSSNIWFMGWEWKAAVILQSSNRWVFCLWIVFLNVHSIKKYNFKRYFLKQIRNTLFFLVMWPASRKCTI